ncbi:MAG: hypothetical protein AAFV53_40510 [Myxococcota bacterium]
MEPIAIASLVVIAATITLPLIAVGLTLVMGGFQPQDEDSGTTGRA